MDKELPINWILIKVVDVSEIVRGITYQKSDASTIKFDNSCLVLRGGNIQDGKIVIEDDCVYVPDSIVKKDQNLRKGDVIIVGSTGSAKLIGKAAFSLSDENEISFGAFLVMVRPYKKIESRYFDYFFLTEFYRTEIRELAGGININNIRREHLEGIDFPLPPLPEQQRIVAKLDSLFGHLDALKARLDGIPQLLKDFRQKVLIQAVTGKLTEEWRVGKELEKWKREKLGDLIIDTPKNGAYYHRSLYGTGTKIIRIDCFYDGKLKDWGLVQRVKIDDNDKLIYEIKTGDILVNRVNSIEYLGKCLLVDNLPEECIFESNMMRVIVNKDLISPEYTKTFLISQNGLSELRKKAKHAVNQASINQQDVKAVEMDYPPLIEQQEIVRRVESLFAKADYIEASYQKLKAKIEQLPQALLAKAFRGELVEQLPTDGDARDLLEEIKKLKGGFEKGGKLKSRRGKT